MTQLPDIERYKFAPLEPGAESCQLRFQFNKNSAPQTWLRARAIRAATGAGEYSYKIGIINPHLGAMETEEGTVYWLYSGEEARLMLDLPNLPEDDDGYLGPMDAVQANKVLAKMQELTAVMHHDYEARRSGAPGPRLS